MHKTKFSNILLLKFDLKYAEADNLKYLEADKLNSMTSLEINAIDSNFSYKLEQKSNFGST